ncbi:nuclear transport factor 2 family protein [Pedobacter sp. WC2501]|uniref:nuclear transport factor 2 family protein n=1 Tax=Pedobacter sp. WC2501 TaxID=3461400 RepID=UPI004045EE05
MDSQLSLAKHLEMNRSKAMISKELEVLNKIFSGDLSYGHSSGLIDNKTEMLDKISNGVYVYYNIETKVLSAMLSGNNLLIIMGNVEIDVSLSGKHRIMDSVYVGVYKKNEDNWEFIAHQTGLIKDKI